MARPITERSNALTANIDAVDPAGMIRLFRQSDAQMFAGFDVWPCIMDEEIIEAMAQTAWDMSRLFANPDARVIMSGAGTSGRLAYVMAMQFNDVLRLNSLPEIFDPLMAGGEAALIQAQEAAEDSTVPAVKDLKEALLNVKTGMYIGITCGLSAPYVAAQIEHLGTAPEFKRIMLGFNPASLARAQEIEGWDKTIKGVIDAALETDNFTLLNPVYGPESITGSTRMKGGSTTKIVIESIFAVALSIVEREKAGEKFDPENLLPLRTPILDSLRGYREAMEYAYGNIASLAELLRLAGTSLRSAGRIHYLGRGVAGLLGIIDASECPPTFGADLFDVRGYIREGWELLGYNTATMKARGRAYEIDHDYFQETVLPEISKGDLVILVAVGKPGENGLKLLGEAARAKAHTALLLITDKRPTPDELPESIAHRCIIEVGKLGARTGFNNYAELALKLCLNAITTGGHAMAGKIYGNVMIDLRISNSKLYHRAIGLIAKLVNVSEPDAQRALHHAIFKEAQTDEEIAATNVSISVARAVVRKRIVPLAMLLAAGKFTFEEAEERLSTEPRVRRIVEEIVGSTA